MKKNAQDKAQKKGKKPFFAQMLEAQQLEQVAGGRLAQTMKYPSDGDDCDDTIITLKYPSDRDEI